MELKLLSERWIKESTQLLEKMKDLTSKEKRDRLEIINSLLFSLNILDRSVHGWRNWIRNLSLMAQFTVEDLIEIEKALHKQIQYFLEYDIETTKRWKDKMPARVSRRRPNFRVVV
jgi:hypothetical protein